MSPREIDVDALLATLEREPPDLEGDAVAEGSADAWLAERQRVVDALAALADDVRIAPVRARIAASVERVLARDARLLEQLARRRDASADALRETARARGAVRGYRAGADDGPQGPRRSA